MKLNLGAGPSKKNGFKSVDLLEGSDFVWDLRNGLPLKKIKRNSVDEIIAENFFEHLPETHYVLKNIHNYDGSIEYKLIEIKPRIKLMQHCWEVMKHGATLTIWGPIGSTEGYFGDPTHQWPMGFNSLDYFCVQQCLPDLDDMQLPFHERKLWFDNYIKEIRYDGEKVFEGQFEKILVQKKEGFNDFIEYTLKAIKV